jgi:hypothetical protein
MGETLPENDGKTWFCIQILRIAACRESLSSSERIPISISNAVIAEI